ncbi:uncharacterized protein LOC135128605 isoform X2 [Zophobas morio]|uniref:uncharacterized protein LOC135128605 isoform X2 n=1 Tax=Zophobas morio TaxID=2755281 RepID=UPI0030828087
MDIEEVLREIKTVSDVVCNEHLDPFCETFDEITTTGTAVDNDEGGHLKILSDNIKPLLRTQTDKGHEILQKHSSKIEQKRVEVMQLLEVRDKLKTENENQEKHLQKIKKQCRDYEEKLNNLQCLKDCIQTYKILTKTHFSFKKGSTVGYVKGSNSSSFAVFDFNNSHVNQQDITKKLWTLLKNVSKEDYENRIIQENNNNKKIILS